MTGNAIRPPTGGAVNQAEATAVVEELRRIVIEQRFPGGIGVVTPFRAQANLIEESDERPDPEPDDERRRYYRLTDLGQRVLAAETQRLSTLIDVAQAKRVLGRGEVV